MPGNNHQTAHACAQTNVPGVRPGAPIRFVAGMPRERNIGCVIVTENHKRRRAS